jgi:aspartyl aminopeptidase
MILLVRSFREDLVVTLYELWCEIKQRKLQMMQDFVVRNDMGCGSTIGPILASGVGIRTVDVGAPQLSMHSIREMCAADDVKHSYEHFKAYFHEFSHLDPRIAVDFDDKSEVYINVE